MTTSVPLLAALRRWDQVLVLAFVVVGSDLASTWWLSRSLTTARSGEAAAGRAARTPPAGVLDDAMATTLEQAARDGGLDPALLPAPRHLWSLFVEQSPEAVYVDVQDRASVEAALTGFVDTLAASERHAEPRMPGGRGEGDPSLPARAPGEPTGGPPPGGPPPGGPPAGGAPSGRSPGAGPPTIARIDQERAAHLTALARERGLDPAAVLPSEAVRRAAVESGELGSAASQELLEAYRAAMAGLVSTEAADR